MHLRTSPSQPRFLQAEGGPGLTGKSLESSPCGSMWKQSREWCSRLPPRQAHLRPQKGTRIRYIMLASVARMSECGSGVWTLSVGSCNGGAIFSAVMMQTYDVEPLTCRFKQGVRVAAKFCKKHWEQVSYRHTSLFPGCASNAMIRRLKVRMTTS